MKSFGVTIQMKPLQQYFHMILFLFKFFKNGSARAKFPLISEVQQQDLAVKAIGRNATLSK